MRRSRLQYNHRRFMALASCIIGITLSGCTFSPTMNEAPFAELRTVSRDGTRQEFRGNAASLGELTAEDALRIRVESRSADSFLLLRIESADSALYIGGGPSGTDIDFTPTVDGEYLVFLSTLDATDAAARMTISAMPIDAAPARPARQVVRVLFAPDFLTAPGLLDPVDGTDDDRAVLEGLAGTVQTEVLEMLRDIFSETPIQIIGADEALPDEPFSTLTFLPDRVIAEDQDVLDAALPALDPTRPQCQVRVIFGEILPRRAAEDVGNRIPDDDAVVYVGSFQGRGRECWTAVINSVNNIVFAIAQTGAHEIGHLIGLVHVEQIDLMNRSATLALLRELDFLRGQVQVERTSNGTTATEVFTSVVQDPRVYFESIFDPASP